MKLWCSLLACCAVVATSTTGARSGDDSAHHPADFHRDRFGCYVPNVPVPTFTQGPIPASLALAPRVQPTIIDASTDGFVRKTFIGQDELSYHVLRARYFSQHNDQRSAAAEYRLASASPPTVGAQPAYHDLVTRLPLSVVLYRAGHIAEARSEWRTMLLNRIAEAEKYQVPMPSPPASVDLLAQHRLDLLAARQGTRFGPEYDATGAGQHTARGIEAANQRRYAAAAVEWRCAAKASPDFELPHLMLGYAAALGGDARTAKNEWIAVLEGVQHGPGDMLTVSALQYDAMEALLRYTRPRN